MGYKIYIQGKIDVWEKLKCGGGELGGIVLGGS